MKFAVMFEDEPSKAAERPKNAEAHFAFLARHAGAIEIGGPMVDPADGAAAGALWVVEAESADAVRALVEEDPFHAVGLRKSVRILRWRQLFKDGARRDD